MPTGIKVTLPSDEEIVIVPNGIGGVAVMTLDDMHIYVRQQEDGWEVGFEKEGKSCDELVRHAFVEESDVEIPEHQASDAESSILRTCINCQGRRYCMSGGCARTPCGWICG